MTRSVLRTRTTLFAASLFSMSVALSGQSGSRGGEWTTYGGDLGNTRYAPLDQITAANFSSLEVAWRFKVDSLGPRPEFNLQSTPLMVKGVLYSTGGTEASRGRARRRHRRAVVDAQRARGAAWGGRPAAVLRTWAGVLD